MKKCCINSILDFITCCKGKFQSLIAFNSSQELAISAVEVVETKEKMVENEDIILAQYYLKNYDFFLSIEHFKKAFIANPEFCPLYEDLYNQAVKGYTKVTSSSTMNYTLKDTVDIHPDIEMAEYYLEMEQFFTAIQFFKQAFSSNPGLFVLYQDKYSRAQDGYKKSLK